MRSSIGIGFVWSVVWMIGGTVSAQSESKETDAKAALSRCMTFHASFDRSVDADYAVGDPSLWSSSDMNKRENAVKGLPADRVTHVKSEGRFGGALRFASPKGSVVFYRGDGNITAPRSDWSGTVSFWLSTDPATDLAPGFCDPIQITSKQWDDASMFVEFEKRQQRVPFRLGVYADKNVWNPNGRKFENIPMDERPLASVEEPPFAANRWVHVVFVFEHFNTNEPDGKATLFLDGKAAAAISPRTQTFSWNASQTAIMLGLNYVGRMDDLAIFNRAFSESEVLLLHNLPNGASELKPAR